MRKKLTQVHRWTKVDDVRAASRSPPPLPLALPVCSFSLTDIIDRDSSYAGRS